MSITFTEAQVLANLGTLKAAIIAAVPGFSAANTAEQNQQPVRDFCAQQTTGTNLTSCLDYQKQVVDPTVPVNDVFQVKVRFLYVDTEGSAPDHIDATLLFTRAELTTP